MIHLFPFEKIDKGSNIVIYGINMIAQEYASQLLKTNYCEVVGFGDEFTNEEFWRQIDYDYVVLAFDSHLDLRVAQNFLKKLNIPDSKIISPSDGLLNFDKIFKKKRPKYHFKRLSKKDFNLGIELRGGIGDLLMLCAFIKELRKFLPPVIIDLYGKNAPLVSDMPFIDNVHTQIDDQNKNSYDVFLSVVRFITVDYIDEKKTLKFSPEFYSFCMNGFNHRRKKKNSTIYQSYVFAQYAKIKGKNRIEQYNIDDSIMFNRYTQSYITWDVKSFEILFKHGLSKAKYVTICNTVAVSWQTCNKLWLPDHFSRLLKLIKQKYPGILIVNIGEGLKSGRIKFVDVDLTGQTTFDEVKVILKYSILNISCEGGMVHLAHFMNVKSAVLFGPTDPELFGYEENINIRSLDCVECPSGCEWLSVKWNQYCLAGYRTAKCMKTLLPEKVFREISKYLDNLPAYGYSLEAVCKEEDLGKFFTARVNAAHIYREDDEKILKLPAIADIEELTVFDRDLSAAMSDDCLKNCFYMEKVKMFNINARAEYGNIYNIPAREGIYDVVTNFTMDKEVYPKFALAEMLRVTKMSGRVIVYMRNPENVNKLNIAGEHSGEGLFIFQKRNALSSSDDKFSVKARNGEIEL
jgi:ADP-heptose:LPS heptosyltransferase